MNEFLRAMAAMNRGDDDEKAKPTRLPEVEIADLREVSALVQAAVEMGCAFSVGDIVTPRENFDLRGAGEPHIVVSILPKEVKPIFEGHPGSNVFGKYVDMRVACFDGDGQRMFYWVESFGFETYAEHHGRKAGKAAAALAAVEAPSAAA